MKEVTNPEGTPEESRDDHLITLLEMILINQLRQTDLLMYIASRNADGDFKEILDAHKNGKIIGDMPYMRQ